MVLLTGSQLQDGISIFEQSSPESLRARALSPHVHDQHSSTSDGRTLDGDTDDDYFSHHKPIKQCTSSRSSISSFPASVIRHTPFTDNEDVDFCTPSKTQCYDRTSKNPNQTYLSAFRHPSSVRALQLESEYADSDALSLRNSPRPRKSPRISHFSPRSPGSVHSSPTKRSSRSGTPLQSRHSSSKLKKEFPLVLLHCTLLPPAVADRTPLLSNETLEAVLPEEYRKRWRTLQDKVIKNSEVKQRGVLIPHPREEYDLLEERLLETLELERPRIRKGHYLGKESTESDSGFESSSQNGSDEGSAADDTSDERPGAKCPDCGKAVSCNIEQARRWEVKVFAANGLMRSGAWSAAWEQMEKVDVEVAVWMPEEVRVEVDARLKALQAKEEAERPVEETKEMRKKSRRTRSNTAKRRQDERMREIYGDAGIDGLVDMEQETYATSPAYEAMPQPSIKPVDPFTAGSTGSTTNVAPTSDQNLPPTIPVQEDFLAFIRRHLRLIWNDQKNLAIVLLSILVLFFSIQNANVNSTKASSVSDEPVGSAVLPLITSVGTASPSDSASISYLTTTVFAAPTTASLPSSGGKAGLSASVELDQKNESGIDVNAVSTSTMDLDMAAPVIENLAFASETAEGFEDDFIAGKPISGEDDSHEVAFNTLVPMLTEVADSEATTSTVEREQMPIDLEPQETAIEEVKFVFQPDDSGYASEDSTAVDSCSASLEDELVSSCSTIQELGRTPVSHKPQADVINDVAPRVPEEYEDDFGDIVGDFTPRYPVNEMQTM